jgi:predicted unusual protein kinase regulating ubiquinone biosynthesis (AarF/ABC1/UbiB family)
MLKARYRQILWFFSRILISVIFWDMLLPRIGLRRLSRRTRPERLKRIARNFRTQAVHMGGVMIKVGQFLSARLDVLPREITDELTGLQDEVQAETYADICRVAEAELGASLAERYLSFETSPMASASIGQVHRASLPAEDPADPPRRVVVKIQRPMIDRIVATDLAALRVVGGWLQRYKPIRRRVNVPRLVEEFSRATLEEIDYLHEGKNAEVFAANFKDDPRVRVPGVIWTHTSLRVLTLEDVQAIKITDYDAITAAGIDRAEVASRLFDTYLKQIFEDRFFHADPHPGNLFIYPLNETTADGKRAWQLVFVDFGMTGELPARTLTGLREILIGVGLKDASRIMRAYQTLEILLPGADIPLLEKATARVFERMWGKTAPELMQMHQTEAMAFVQEFNELIFDLPFQVPENLVLLVRCLGILSGMCTGLDADFNVWTGIAPYAQKLAGEEGGLNWKTVLAEGGDFVRLLISLPRKAETLLQKMEQGKLQVQTPELTERTARLEAGVQRLTAAVVFAAFLLAAVQLYSAGFNTLAIAAIAAAGLAFLWLLFTRPSH